MLSQTSQLCAGDANSGTFILRQQGFYQLSHSQSFYTMGFLRSYPACVLVSFSWQAVRRRHCPWRLYQNITPQTECKELTSNLLCREDSSPQKERFGCGCRGQQPWEANFSYPWLIGNHEALYAFERKKKTTPNHLKKGITHYNCTLRSCGDIYSTFVYK